MVLNIVRSSQSVLPPGNVTVASEVPSNHLKVGLRAKLTGFIQVKSGPYCLPSDTLYVLKHRRPRSLPSAMDVTTAPELSSIEHVGSAT